MMKRKTSILLAESATDLANVLASYLTNKGFDVSIANDGVIAKKRLLSSDFDFLITDVVMPEVDGLQLLTWLNQRGLVINVVVTSSINFEQLPLPNQTNIIMRLFKPYNEESLSALVTKLKNSKELTK